ncbi:4Fe-4S dicluster domain-containing protein [Moorella naiadis]|uniref:4Fe-4S dicluster domain-containing protein n=1 Tax=Moorella naiadis (nom. illeg.) TaxID=3093670 RepID=UPI003D9C8464
MPRLAAAFDLCTGCGICQLACSFRQTGNQFNPRWALLRIELRQEGLISWPVACAQCRNAFCLSVCPAGAIHREDNGIVTIKTELCTGCGLCSQYCPLQVITVRNGVAYKCDLCQGQPECVAACPAGALMVVAEEG